MRCVRVDAGTALTSTESETSFLRAPVSAALTARARRSGACRRDLNNEINFERGPKWKIRGDEGAAGVKAALA